MHTGALIAGSVVCISADLVATPADADSADNNFQLCDTVRMYIPPVLKTAASDSMQILSGSILQDKEILYTLSATNIGSDTVHAVYAWDALDDNLDLSTFSVLYSSAAANWYLDDNILFLSAGELELLPGQSFNAVFSIRPVPSWTGLPLIMNTAGMAPENKPTSNSSTVLLTMYDPLSISSGPLTPLHLWLYPNPAHNYFEIVSDDSRLKQANVAVTNATGMLIAGSSLAAGHLHLETVGWAPGIYLVNVHVPGISKIFKLTVY